MLMSLLVVAFEVLCKQQHEHKCSNGLQLTDRVQAGRDVEQSQCPLKRQQQQQQSELTKFDATAYILNTAHLNCQDGSSVLHVAMTIDKK